MKNISRILLSSLLACSIASLSYSAEPTPSRFSWTSFKGECPVKGLSVKGIIKRVWPYIGLFAFLHVVNQVNSCVVKESPTNTAQSSNENVQAASKETSKTALSKTQEEMIKLASGALFGALITDDFKAFRAYVADFYERYFPTLAIV